ncbi:MAG: MBL fold metallo-hydrolase [Gemmatimonadota bacterium]
MLVVVGCGTVVPEPGTGGSSFWADLDGTRALIDCGPGAVQALARLDLPWPEMTDLVLTHFHADHIGALPGLFFSLTHGLAPAVRTAPLDVWGPPGTNDLMTGLARVLGSFVLDPGFEVRVHEIEPGQQVHMPSGADLMSFKTPHTTESQAVRISSPVGSIGYSGDTGPCPELGDFMHHVDVLVCECSLTDDLVGDNHLSPTGVARIASRAEPGELVITHVYPHVREAHDVVALIRDQGYDGRVSLASEGLQVPLS